VKDEKQIMKSLNIESKGSLPKIKKSDPVLKILSKIEGPIEAGRIIKIVRDSSTAGQIILYRMVTEE
jgi:DNA-directed RNA polymerase subunit H (RpoH/RPB5)